MILRTGYLWPTIFKHFINTIQKCRPYQIFSKKMHANLTHLHLVIEVGPIIPILWITKDIMSRGPWVEDMECREDYMTNSTLCTIADPSHHHRSSQISRWHPPY
jgi:hypothetical protein